MRINDHFNLAVFHLRHRRFGPGRFDTHVVHATHERPRVQQVRLADVHAADRAAVVPVCEHCRHAFNPCDLARERGWPYDTAFPTGLPRLDEQPGWVLTDLPSSGAALAKLIRSDNTLFISTQPQLTSGKTYTADHIGKVIDVMA